MTRNTFNILEVSSMLASCDIHLQADFLQDHDELGQGAKAVLLKRYGVDVWLILEPVLGRDKIESVYDHGIVSCRVVLGFVPKAAVAALFRRLLGMNVVTSRARLALYEQDGSVCLVEGIRLPVKKDGGLSFDDFCPTLDAIVAAYHEHAPELIKEFQLPQQPC